MKLPILLLLSVSANVIAQGTVTFSSLPASEVEDNPVCFDSVNGKLGKCEVTAIGQTDSFTIGIDKNGVVLGTHIGSGKLLSLNGYQFEVDYSTGYIAAVNFAGGIQTYHSDPGCTKLDRAGFGDYATKRVFWESNDLYYVDGITTGAYVYDNFTYLCEYRPDLIVHPVLPNNFSITGVLDPRVDDCTSLAPHVSCPNAPIRLLDRSGFVP